MGETLSAVGQFFTRRYAWLIAIIVPVANGIHRELRRQCDFAIPATIVLPTILATVIGGLCLFSIYAPYGGWLVWLSYHPLYTIILILVALMFMVGWGALLVLGGHRALLRFWQSIPILQMRDRALPILDRRGVVDAFARVQAHLSRLRPTPNSREEQKEKTLSLIINLDKSANTCSSRRRN